MAPNPVNLFSEVMITQLPGSFWSNTTVHLHAECRTGALHLRIQGLWANRDL